MFTAYKRVLKNSLVSALRHLGARVLSPVRASPESFIEQGAAQVPAVELGAEYVAPPSLDGSWNERILALGHKR